MAKKARVTKKKNTGNKQKKFVAGSQLAFTPKQIIDALDGSMGFKSGAARILKCSVKTINNYINRFPEIKEHLENEIDERRKDIVEGKILTGIQEGSVPLLIFYAKTQMKDRGYIERQQFDVNQRSINVNVDLTPSSDNTQDAAIELFKQIAQENSRNKANENNEGDGTVDAVLLGDGSD